MTRSTFAKSLSATLRPDRAKRLRSDDYLMELPTPPPGLSVPAVAAWHRIGALAIEARTITRFDLELLSLTARTAASCDELEAQLITDGLLLHSSGIVKSHPACAALDRSRGLLFRLLEALGLSPVGRGKLPEPMVTLSVNRFSKLSGNEYFR